jgi:hypothetical protein
MTKLEPGPAASESGPAPSTPASWAVRWGGIVVVILVVGLVANLWGAYRSTQAANRAADIGAAAKALGAQNNAILGRFDACTLPGPRQPTPEDPRTGHGCYDDQQALLRRFVAYQSLSIDCTKLWPAVQPPPCADVDRRLNSLMVGILPPELKEANP